MPQFFRGLISARIMSARVQILVRIKICQGGFQVRMKVESNFLGRYLSTHFTSLTLTKALLLINSTSYYFNIHQAKYTTVESATSCYV